MAALATRSLVEELVDGGEDNGGPGPWAAPVAGCAWSTICLRISLLFFDVRTCLN